MDRKKIETELYVPELQDASLLIAQSKYFLPGEDLDGMRRRLARALAKPEADPTRWEESFYWALHYAFPGGRIMANAGAEALKPNTSTINCTVSRAIDDSMRGIMMALSEAALTLKAGCGIGYDFSTLRPHGAWVQGAGATTSGPLPFMDVFDAACKTISSAGGRRGAQMGCLDISHPDIEAFILSKRESGRLRAFNMSCLISDAFVHAVRQDKPWPLVFPAFPGEQEEHDVIWRHWPLADPRYTLNERGDTACKVYRYVRARDLWALVMHSTYDFSDPGFILIDEINRTNPLWFCEDIRATNPCVSGETWVHTAEGPRQVRELVGRRSMLYVNGQAVATTSRGFYKTGFRAVVRLTTREGYVLRLTHDHRILCCQRLASGQNENNWINAGKLKPGDRVVLNDHRPAADWNGIGVYHEGYLLGLLVTNGIFSQEDAVLSTWAPRAAVGMTTAIESMGFMKEASRCGQLLQHGIGRAQWLAVTGCDTYRLSFPGLIQLVGDYGLAPERPAVTPRMERGSSHFCRGLLRGLCDANAVVNDKEMNHVSLELTGLSHDCLQAVQRMLLRFGIVSVIEPKRHLRRVPHVSDTPEMLASSTTSAPLQLKLSESNVIVFRERIGFTHPEKVAQLDDALSRHHVTPSDEDFNAIVQSIEPDGEEFVYDVEVPERHAFDANGFYVHNCGEQPLPPHGACLLGSVNLASMIRQPFTKEACFDFETLRDVVRIFSRMLDNVVDVNALPLPQQRHEIMRKRRHGMGYLGLGSALTMLGIRYGSPESVAFTEKVTKLLALESWRAALELAREKGPAPILQETFEVTPAMLDQRPELASENVKAGTKLPGRVLHARYSRYMQRIGQVDPDLVDALAEVGARFTHATSIAPTGTMAASVGNNASNGIEPSFAHSYTRNMIVPGEKAKRAVRMESYELLVYRQVIDPKVDLDNLPECFCATATGTDPREHIDVQAAAQQWIDSSISKTVNVPPDIDFEAFQDLYLYAIDKGLKGCTTFRFNPEVHQGVLVSTHDLAKTLYTFRLADGRTIDVPGDAIVEYEGHEYTAANLYDALKEGFYGKL